ncbi:MAG: response regulator [Nitrospiraceae bacterium]
MAALLVIDDEPGVLEFLALVLRQAGHTVVTADNGREAFRILHQSPVDLVLTDIYMPLNRTGSNWCNVSVRSSPKSSSLRYPVA